MIGVFFIVCVSLAGLFYKNNPSFSKHIKTHPFIVPITCCLLCIEFCYQAFLLSYTAFMMVAHNRWLALSPLVVLRDTLGSRSLVPPIIASTVEIISICTSLTLVFLWFIIDPYKISRIVKTSILISTLFMISVSFFISGVSSSDLYAYAADARLGLSCYAGVVDFTNTPFYVIHHYWGLPFIPCSYGPIWLLCINGLFGALPSVYLMILALRILDALVIVSCIAALVMLRVQIRSLALLAVNPAIYLQYLVDGHNDLFMVSLVLWARVLVVRKQYVLACGFVALASSSKLTFFLIGLLVFYDIASRRLKIQLCCLATLFGLVISAIFGGLSYVHALMKTMKLYAVQSHDLLVMLYVTFAIACISLFTAIMFKRIRFPIAFSYLGTSSIIFPWYVAWSLPYVFIDSESALPFLASLPVLTFALSTVYQTSVMWELFVYMMIVCAFLFVASAILSNRRRGGVVLDDT